MVYPIEYELDDSGKGYSFEYRRTNRIDWYLIHEALAEAQVIPVAAKLTRYKEFSSWLRKGSETYSCIFEIEYINSDNDNQKAMVIAKALISPVTNIEGLAVEWVKRARELESYNIKTCTFGSTRGCVYQKYLPVPFVDLVVSASHNQETENLRVFANKLKELAIKLGQASFRPLSLLSDLRADQNEPVIVDLGEDLGSRIQENSQEYVENLISLEIQTLIEQLLVTDDFARLMISDLTGQ